MAHSVQLLQDVLDSSHLERDLIGVLVGGVTNARVFDVREGLRGQPAVLVTHVALRLLNYCYHPLLPGMH